MRPCAQVAAIEREAIEGVEDGLAATPKQIVKPRAPAPAQDDNFTIKPGRVFHLRVIGAESDIIA